RFHSVRLLEQSFARRPGFDLPTYWRAHIQSYGSAFSEYHCTLRIHPERVSFVKWLMPGRWELVAEAEETGWVTMSLRMDSDLLAKMLVFGLAGSVEVISPPELRESVVAQARAVIEHLAP
ncbi:MAG TPA: WYL domain-containing protein, partial [Anaerolineales bacterium]|nr:WYL domain-containing protein [Anaerolineales bacterium]